MKGTGVGAYLAVVIETNNFSVARLPLGLFVVSIFMPYAMGSTLGTVVLTIPIDAEVVVNIDPRFPIHVIGTVFAGCVFGERTSPLSDKTLVSSIGSQVDSFDHIVTQMPHVVITSVASILGLPRSRLHPVDSSRPHNSARHSRDPRCGCNEVLQIQARSWFGSREGRNFLTEYRKRLESVIPQDRVWGSRSSRLAPTLLDIHTYPNLPKVLKNNTAGRRV